MNIKNSGNVQIVFAIVVAALIIGGAIIFSGKGNTQLNNNGAENVNTQEGENLAENVKPVTEEDHIVGSVNAKVKLIEFSDTECPFCKRFHETTSRLIGEYSGDDFALVYRHFPLEQLHAKAKIESHATECVADLAGEDAFWSYLNKIYVETPSNDGLDLANLEIWATELGIDSGAFNECMNSNKFMAKIDSQIEDAVNAGGRGTPFSVVIGPDDQFIPISGAQPYESVKQLIDSLLQE